MGTYSVRKWLVRWDVLTLILLMSVMGSGVSLAADASVTMSISVDYHYPVIGTTPHMYTLIYNPLSDAIRVVKLQCDSDNPALRAMSIHQLPSIISANDRFLADQYYRAMSAGTAIIHCDLTAVDTVTGATVTATGTSDPIEVQSETRLYYSASSGTHVATVEQAYYLDVIYGNRGNTPFTILEQSCEDFGRHLVFSIKSPAPSTILPPGQTFHVQYAGTAFSKGDGFIQCILRATDSDGNAVRLFSDFVRYTVK